MLGEAECAAKRLERVFFAAEPSAQGSARRMRRQIVEELAAREQLLDERKASGRAVASRHGNCAREPRYGRWVDTAEHIVERHDLRPVDGVIINTRRDSAR